VVVFGGVGFWKENEEEIEGGEDDGNVGVEIGVMGVVLWW